MKKHQTPHGPEQLLEQLFEIFPQYRIAYDGPIHDGPPTFHSVLLAFTPFFGECVNACSPKQLYSFALLVRAAQAEGGCLENAFGTCLLEHLRHIGAAKVFRPYLKQR